VPAFARTSILEGGGLLGLAALLLYAWLAPAHVLGGDNAEFVTLGVTGGVAHPSGYPLYVLWLRATSWLPASSAAHAAALSTALLAAAQILALAAACRAWGAGPTAAGLAAAVHAGGPIALELHSQAEVFALHGLLSAAILGLAGPASPARGARRVAGLGLVGGLALCNHLTAALLLPAGAYGVARGLSEVAAGRRLRTAVLGAAAFVLGLSPALYLFVAPAGGISWGEIRGWADLVHHVLRVDYGTTTLTPHGAGGSAGAGLAALFASLARAWWGAGAAIGFATLVAMAAHPRARDRAAWCGLLAALALAGPVLVSLFNVPPHGLGAWIARRFHLLPCLILAIPVAVGLTRLAARLVPATRLRSVAPALPLIALVAAAAPSLESVARAHSPAVERFADHLLAIAPPRAVLMLSGDDVTFGLAHAQIVGRRRADVVHVAWHLMTLPWYQRRVSRRLGSAAVPPGDGPPSVRLAEAVLESGRPLLVDAAQTRILAALPSYPFGPVIRVLPRGATVPPPDAVFAANRSRLANLDLGYSHPGRDDGWATVVHERYARPWRTLADALGRAGLPAEAAQAAALAARLAPAP
jgi:hypothetical protein